MVKVGRGHTERTIRECLKAKEIITHFQKKQFLIAIL